MPQRKPGRHQHRFVTSRPAMTQAPRGHPFPSDKTTFLNPASRNSTAFSWARVKPRHSYSTCAALAGSVAWMQ
jgi:hypothetical protein